uniref:T9SS type A sorting domain-containing protein n=3 Tax=Roseivirga sp. TaxID=1964215 RepID=UPI0040483490
MKKLTFILALFVLVGTKTIAQENFKNPIALKSVPEQIIQKLSSVEQVRIQKLKQSDDYLSVKLIEVSNLAEAIKNDRIEFDMPGRLGRIHPKTQRLDYSSESNFQYNGTFNGGEVMLISENGRTFGQIRDKGAVYDIQYLENGYATLVEYNMKKLSQLSCATPDTNENTPESKANNQNQQYNGGMSSQSLARVSPNASIKVLVLYTPAAASTGLNMNDLANTARAQWVSASVNSQVVSTLFLAGVQPLNFVENSNGNTIVQDIQALRNNTQAQQFRDSFEADIVLLFTLGNYPGAAGRVSAIGPDSDDAFGIVQVAAATSNITWVHEAAHLFGARHQFAVDDEPGDAHGHFWNSGIWPFLDKYRSIMGTLDNNRERVLHFSNPSVTHQNKATGVVGTSFNVKTINNNGHILEDFRFTQPNLSVAIYGPGTANNGDGLSFSASTSNGQSPYTYQWRVNTGTGYYTVGSAPNLSFTMPIDQDLEVTLNIGDGNSQTASDYHFVRNLFLGGGPCTVCPDSTLMDFNNRSDLATENNFEENELIVFPNPTSYLLSYHLPLSERTTSVKVVDFEGNIIFESTFSSIDQRNSQQTLNTSNLKSGIYLLKISNLNGFEKTIKFIKN